VSYATVNINLLKVPITWCTNRFNIQQLYALPTLFLCVLYLSQNNHRLVIINWLVFIKEKNLFTVRYGLGL